MDDPQAEIGRLRAKNAELNRRCQAAESVANENVEACQRAGRSLGRGLANYAAADYKRKLDSLLSVIKRWKELAATLDAANLIKEITEYQPCE